MAPLRLAVIGVGHLGKEHARILSSLADVELVGVVDTNFEQAQAVARRCGTQGFNDYWPLLNRIDAAVVAVPTCFHHAVASALLPRGIPLLVEKPLAPTLEQAEELVALARRHSVVLQVGHIERFNPALEELERRPLQPKFIECERCGPFTGRSMDIGVVLDLMIHDLDVLLALTKSSVTRVEALGLTIFGKVEDLCHVRLHFANGCVANVSASRVHPSPTRQMRLWGPEGFAQLDFAQRSLKLIQPSARMRQHPFELRALDPATMAMLKNEMFGRHLQVLQLDCNQGDQLTRELQDFIHCVRTGAQPRVSGEAGRDAIALAERIQASARNHAWTGDPVGPRGPNELPAPLGMLFPPAPESAAA
jgi:predicted dehydrogenase